MIPPLFDHQAKSLEFHKQHPRVLDFSDPGTGKTRTSLEATRYRLNDTGKRALVLAPKAILQPAWGNDIEQFTPDLTYSIAYAHNREKAFKAKTDIVITNVDATRWLATKGEKYLDQFSNVILDESDHFKHSGSARSKAARKVVAPATHVTALTGTPFTNSITEIWHQVFLVDNGEHFPNYWKFRQQVCHPVEMAGFIKWVDKEGAEEAVSAILEDITIRNIFEECVDIPPNTEHTITFDLSSKHQAVYEEFKENARLEIANTKITARHAGVLANRLLQVASGSVYNDEHNATFIASERYELVMELARQREQCIVVFNWTHQKEELLKLARKMDISFGLIDGTVGDSAREKTVALFQEGKLKVIFAHPQSAAHGLTLTRGTTTIWSSPIWNADRFLQLNRRIYRAGQTQKTETLMVAANNTADTRVYSGLNTKIDKLKALLDLVSTQDLAA